MTVDVRYCTVVLDGRVFRQCRERRSIMALLGPEVQTNTCQRYPSLEGFEACVCDTSFCNEWWRHLDAAAANKPNY